MVAGDKKRGSLLSETTAGNGSHEISALMVRETAWSITTATWLNQGTLYTGEVVTQHMGVDLGGLD